MVDDPHFDRYQAEIDRIESRLQPQIENNGRAAFEYGVLIQKHLFYLYGGTLVIVPPLLQAAKHLGAEEALFVAMWIFGSIILLTVCTYITHLNWNFSFSLSQHERVLEHRRVIERIWGESEGSCPEIENINKKMASLRRKIVWTFYLPHAFGIASLITYAIGGALIIGGVASE